MECVRCRWAAPPTSACIPLTPTPSARKRRVGKCADRDGYVLFPGVRDVAHRRAANRANVNRHAPRNGVGLNGWAAPRERIRSTLVLWSKESPMPFRDNVDGAVDHSDRDLI